MINKLFEECIENIDKNEMSYNGTLNDRKNVFGSCTAYIVLFFVFLSIGIGAVYFCWCTKSKDITRPGETTIY